MVGGVVAPDGGTVERAEQRVGEVGMRLHPVRAQREHLFDAAPPDARSHHRDLARARRHRDTAPRLARHEAVDLATLQRLRHQRRREHAQRDVAVGIDAGVRGSVAKPERVGGEAMHDADHRLAPIQPDRGGEVVRGRFRVGDARLAIGVERGGKSLATVSALPLTLSLNGAASMA